MLHYVFKRLLAYRRVRYRDTPLGTPHFLGQG